MENKEKTTSSALKEKYNRFRTHLRRSWINVQLHLQIKEILKEKCKDNDYANKIVTDCKSPVGADNQENIRLRGKSLLGFVESKKGAGTEWALEWTLASSIALFEAFISDTAAIAYLSDPERFLLGEMNQNSTDRENYKVSEIIIKSNSREEALEKIVEEKLRSIFYGNPIDAFIKYNKDCTSHRDGKLRLKLNNILNNNCKIELKLYAEMVGRRNAIVHNAGIIDSKYVREVGVKRLSLGDKVKINDTYLFDSLKALDTIAKFYIEQVFCTIGIDEKPKNAKL